MTVTDASSKPGTAIVRPCADPDQTPEADEAVRLWEEGLRPVLLSPIGARVYLPGRGETRSDGKDPVERDWGLRSYDSEDEIRDAYAEHPAAGVGLLLGLGPDRGPLHLGPFGGCGPIDLEVDDPAAAAPTLEAIFGPKGPPPTRGWSSSRGDHSLFMLWPGSAERLVEHGIVQAVLSGSRIPCLAGLEVRLGTLDPGAPKQVQSACPPTRTLRKDGSISEPRRYRDPDAEIDRFPRALMDYLIRHLGRPPQRSRLVKAGGMRIDPDPIPREELAGLSPYGRVQYALEALDIPVTLTEEGLTSRCPCHGRDGGKHNFTAAEKVDDEGRPLAVIYCHAGCDPEDLVASLGLTLAQLFPGRYARDLSAGGARRRRSNISSTANTSGPDLVSDEDCEAWDREFDRLYVEPYVTDHSYARELASRLGLPTKSLDSLPMGIRLTNRVKVDDAWVDRGPAWIWPERDARGRTVGLMRRYIEIQGDGKKKQLVGSRFDDPDRPGVPTHRAARGLVYNLDALPAPGGPIWIVEGESDFLALAHAGKACVGRPSNSGGVVELGRLLLRHPGDIIVLGENDRKPDGQWPGDPRPVAERLRRLLTGRRVGAQLPPPAYKDARDWVIGRREGGRP